MSPLHHPGEDTLIAYAAGTLGAGPALMVAIHLEGCGHCRALVAALEVAGGVLMEQLSPVALSSLALARAMAAIDLAVPKPQPVDAVSNAPPMLAADLVLPAALRGMRIGRWRWLAPGLRWSRVDVPGSPDANVMLMRGRAGAQIPAHGHQGLEFTQVLGGAIVDAAMRYGAGDMMEADDAINHRLQVATDGECICIAALEGRTRLNGLIGRLVQPLVGQ